MQVAKDEDTYQEALMYSGVPSIEEAINEYLEKWQLHLKLQQLSILLRML